MVSKIIILHFADLHLGVETYGHTDPVTGLSTRLGDFLRAFDELTDYAIGNKIDIVLFCGDAYKSRNPSQTQQREFAKRIDRLSGAGIPVVLIIGNHDLPNTAGKATATEIFGTLSLKGVYVSQKPEILIIDTPSGKIQIATLPWLRRSAYIARLSNDEQQGLSLKDINIQMSGTLSNIVSGHAAALDPKLPAVLAAHLSVAEAKTSSEATMIIGNDPVLLLSSIAIPAFDYVALGHIHKKQVLSTSPPIVYSGSLERLDFGEERDDKGFYVIEIETDTDKTVSYQFHKLDSRPFITIDIKLEDDEITPTDTVLTAINIHGSKLENAIVRLKLDLPEELENSINDNAIKEALSPSHNAVISRSIRRNTELRLTNQLVEELTPLQALKAYIKQKDFNKALSRQMLAGASLILKEVNAGED